MTEYGYALIHRKIINNSLYFAEVFSRNQAWIDMILIANYTNRKIDIRGNLISVSRGQIARSEANLAERWKWSRGKVRRFLKVLVDEGMIVQQKTPAITLISIVNYDAYQSNKSADRTSVKIADGTQTNNDKLNKTIIHSISLIDPEADEGEKSPSKNYLPVLDCWKEELINAGMPAKFIGNNSKKGAIMLASAIDEGEITLVETRKAIRNLLADTEKRGKYSLFGLANNFELWLSCPQSKNDKTIQFNQTKNLVYYHGTCENCGYSVTNFEEGAAICPRCKNQIELRKEK